ncbi:hypothetical protein E2C01_096110 [Portunus trituberculatus]|uniref:Uncharacterized protein n=1 Tax=Portunus trituberculatus TaxID=210409 RepID=A0A5B7K7E9_PORTR|nr:hypothetical protein [Portunus trituberculatus]
MYVLYPQISILEGGLGLGSPPPTRPTNTAVPKEENRKKDSGGTLSSCLRQKLSSVICTTDNKASTGTVVTAKKRDVTSGTLYNLLASCLDNMPDGGSSSQQICIPVTGCKISKANIGLLKLAECKQVLGKVRFNIICCNSSTSHLAQTESSGIQKL